jgi:hypothetical protein
MSKRQSKRENNNKKERKEKMKYCTNEKITQHVKERVPQRHFV